MLKKYGPNWVPYEQQILKWARTYHVDAMYVGAILLQENAQANPGAVSPAGAIGPAQIQDTTVDPGLNPTAVWDGPSTLTASWKQNFSNAIKYIAWRTAGAVDHYGSLDGAYAGSDGTLRGYNPGFTGAGPSRFIPKGYIPSGSAGTSPTPAETAGVSAAGTAARADITNPWVVIKNGHITTVTGAQPKNVLTYGNTPLRLSDYNSAWKQSYQDTFFAYTGRKASATEIQSILKNAPSVYALANELAARPGFQASPVFKQHAPALLADARSIMGNTFNPPKGLISQAIAGNWDQATFEEKIRQLPSYTSSVEYKTNYAKAESVWESTYGSVPDASVKGLFDEVTKQGWTQDQFQSWLMHQDAYKQTPSYQAKAMSFLTQLGLITGGVPTLTKDQVDATLTAGDNLHIPGAYRSAPSGPAPTAAPGTTPGSPVDKPTGVGPTGFGG